jgi:histidinol phosphatase-like PHP family hydrolase
LKSSPPSIILEARALDLKALPRIEAHIHTNWTDGTPTVVEAYDRAVSIGLEAILYSEHCRKTSTDWFGKFAAEVRALPSAPCKAHVGAEVKVETLDGEIDTIPEISDLCDYIMASVHRFPTADGGATPFGEVNPAEAVEREFALSWAVLENPQVDILGHVFGMSYRRFNVVPPSDKIRALIERAARTGVAIEVNSHYHPNPLEMVAWCQEFGARITFGSNAHKPEEIGNMTRIIESLA